MGAERQRLTGSNTKGEPRGTTPTSIARPVALFRRGAAPTTRSGRATTRASTSARSSWTTPATARARRCDVPTPVGSVLSTMFGP